MTIISKDLLWKGIIEDFFSDFLTYFYPNAEDIFDFSKGFEFLDKEFEQITDLSESKNRVADKLVKVFTREGKEQWILIHVEVQGYTDKVFSERMFTYYYRIFDKYQKPILAFALLTDDSPRYRPKRYNATFLDTSLSYSYRTFKLSDSKPEDFQHNSNPFSIVLETAWYALKKNRLSDENLFALKLDLARRFYQKGFPKETFSKMCGFIRDYISFGNTELLPKLVSKIDEIDKPARPMGILEIIEQETRRQATEQGLAEGIAQGIEKGMKKGMEKGIEKGIEKGMEKGIEKGIEQTLVDNIKKIYNKGFSAESISEMLEIPIDFVKNAVS